MKLSIHTLAHAAVLASLICSSSWAQQPENVASHCKKEEFAYLNANMSKIHDRNGGYDLIKTGKVLSICTDRQSEPFHSVAYRFGSVGKIEMERIATPSSKFRIFTRQTSPHTGENIIFFTSGPYTYCVSEALGQGNGIGLTVFKSGQQVLDLFSGTESGIDFESGMIDVDFDFSSARSPVFQHFDSANPLQTPCDPLPGK
jgi:hypothetical protein